MTLAEALAPFVSERTRTKGNRCFLGGAVRTIEGSPAHVTATVRGTEWYQVHLTRTREEVLASCGCPLFTDRLDFCKHIWAVILAADAEGHLIGDTPITRDLFLEAAYTDYLADDEVWGGDERDEGAWPARARIVESRRPAQPWERVLRAVQERSVLHADASADRYRKGEILYVIASDEGQPDLVPTVQVQWRTRRKNGEWGKPQAAPIAPSDIERLPDPLDGQVMTLLLGATEAYAIGPYQSLASWASFRLVGPLIDRVLPLLAQSGRLHLRAAATRPTGAAREVGDRFPTAAGPPLTWDAGMPWGFHLDVRDADPLVVTGTLVRDGEPVPAGAPAAILARGFLVVSGAVARLDARGALAWLLELRRTGPIAIPRTAAASLMETMARTGIDPAKLPESLRYDVVAVRPYPRVRITRGQTKAGHGARQDLEAVVEFDYDGTIVPPGPSSGDYDATRRRMIRRDQPAEHAALTRLQQLGFYQPWYAAARGPALAIPVDRFPAAVRTLVEEQWFVEAEGRTIRAGRGMTMHVRSGVDWFELHGEVDFGRGRPVPVAELLAALRRGEATIVLDDGTRGMLPEAWLERYARIASFGEPCGDHVRYAPAQTALLDALLEAQPAVAVDETFARARAELARFRGIVALEPPAGFRGRLREYQREALGWFAFLRQFGFGGCLADDMGLGKTVMVLALLESRRAERPPGASRPSVAVVPRSLVFNWIDEAGRFTPDLRVLDYTGEARTSAAVEAHDLVLTTYGTLRRDVEKLAAYEFDYVILDEAQTIKNPATASAKAARLLRGRHRLALSGTPVENHLGELWSLFDFLNPGWRDRRSGGQEGQEGDRRSGGQEGQERNRRSGGQEGQEGDRRSGGQEGQEGDRRSGGQEGQEGDRKSGGQEGQEGTRVMRGAGARHTRTPFDLVLGASARGERMDLPLAARALRPFILRRTKQQVAPELPDRIEQTIHCELDPEQRRFYDSVLAHYRETLLARVAEQGIHRSRMQVLEALLRLRQAASHPGLVDARRASESSAKFDVLLARLREVVDEGHKALVFSQFTSLLGLLRGRLDAEPIAYEYLDGRTRVRAQRVARFEADASCPLFLISLKAGGVGLNLTAAGYVFLLDPWWNPAVEAQAIDRAHRIGQSKHVFAYRLIARDTVEEKIAELQRSKRQLADAILTEDRGVLRTLGPDELAWLLA